MKYKPHVKSNLFISKKATLILPTHRLLDQAYEKEKGENKIGSTLKGIGPTYQDKIGRQGLRVGDILSDNFSDKFKKLTTIHFNILKAHDLQYDWSELEKQFMDAITFLKQFN